MSKQLTVNDLQALVVAAESAVSESRADWQTAKDKLDTGFPALSSAGDEVSIAKLRKGIKDALQRFEDARDDCARLKQQLHRAQQAEAAAETARRIDDAKQKAHVWQSEVETLQVLLGKVSTQYDKCCEAGLAFRSALPNQIGESELTMLWSPATLAQNAQIYLYGISGGKFPARCMASPWQVVQGPGLRERARENVQRALNKQPTSQLEPTPPAAA